MADVSVNVSIHLTKEEKDALVKAHHILQEVMVSLGEEGQNETEEFYNAVYGVEHIGYLLGDIGLETEEINRKEDKTKEENKEIWSWNEKDNEDWFKGTFSTREEAVE